MKLLDIFGYVVEITNLESIVKDTGGFIIKRSAKGSKVDLLECPIRSYCITISELANIIFEAESNFNNYLIVIESDYNSETDKHTHKYEIKGTKF